MAKKPTGTFFGMGLLFLGLTLGQLLLPLEAADRVRVSAGQKMKVEGVIVERSADEFILRDHESREMAVLVVTDTRIAERKKNLLRSRIQYSGDDLIPGLNVVVTGVGDMSGNLIAQQIRFTQDDLKVAETIWSRVTPMENRLGETEALLEQTRQEAHNNRLATKGRIEELDAAFKLSREEAKEAHSVAVEAQQTADLALESAKETDSRVNALDDFQEVSIVNVFFALNRFELTADAKNELDKLAAEIGEEGGYLLEVTGYASSDGNAEHNRRLSQQRADRVVQYLVEQHGIPLRRMLSAFGHGESLPEAENDSPEGRKRNRRVQVRFLINSGLAGQHSSG